MSAINQSNGKKSVSSNSSMVNTPASTPLSSMSNGQSTTQTSPTPNNNAPKYGTLVPNRIFVGGISANTTEGELLQLFSNYGTVKAAKIIQDRAGVSKGYGFITFESEDDAKRLQREADNIVLRERKLNIAPAIKKQPFSRGFDASSPPAVAPGNPAQYFFQPGAMPYFQGGVAYYPQPPTGPADPSTPQQAVYQQPSVYPTQSAPPQTAAYPPVMFPAQPIYMPQQYPMPIPYEYNYYAAAAAAGGGSVGYGQQQPTGVGGGGMQQRPSSPPRAPPQCYAQQLPASAYGAAGPGGADPASGGTMYYNVPLYGPPGIDGPAALYAADAGSAAAQQQLGALADMQSVAMAAANGALSEDTYHQQQHIAPISMGAALHHHHQQQQQATTIATAIHEVPAANNQAVHAAAVHNGGCDEPPHHINQTPPPHKLCALHAPTTPVVSLLSLDQHQDKDHLSMQSGRRRKTPLHHNNATQSSTSQYNGASNGYYSYMSPPSAQQQAYQQPAQVHYHQSPVNGGLYYIMPNTANHYNHTMHHKYSAANTQAQQYQSQFQPSQQTQQQQSGWARKRRSFMTDQQRHSFETSSMTSSLRTDSNSSASIADEIHRNINNNNNTDSETLRMTGVDTPPPAPYSPIAQFYTTRLFTNTQRPHNPTNPNTTNHHYKYTQSHNNYNRQQQMYTPTSQMIDATLIAAGTTTTTAKPPISPQMHAGSQHFVPPSRRNRRTVRRNGSSLSEIGAGDAPLPNSTAADSAASVTEACNKLDSLKL